MTISKLKFFLYTKVNYTDVLSANYQQVIELTGKTRLY